jgi:hypothetical protein
MATDKGGNTNQRADHEQWVRTHNGESHDAEWFTAHILPGLTGVTLTRIVNATGMSTSAPSKVRAGRRVPHPRHWEALGKIAATS